MNTLLTLRDSDIFPGASNDNPDGFLLRQAARAVLIDENAKVALLYVGKGNYFKLPGGGVEAGEDMKRALERELREEIGCSAMLLKDVGEIVELKNEHKEKQTSRCWIARTVGGVASPAFTEEEMQAGFRVQWADNIAHAITLLERCKPSDYTGHFIKRRDLTFLKAAKALL